MEVTHVKNQGIHHVTAPLWDLSYAQQLCWYTLKGLYAQIQRAPTSVQMVCNYSTCRTFLESLFISTEIINQQTSVVNLFDDSHYFQFLYITENVVISTSENFRYEFVSAPRNRAGVVFEVKVKEGAHIGLSDVRYTSDRMYQVVLGDAGNTMSWIGRGKHGEL